MLVVGIIAVLVILFSQAFRPETTHLLSKLKHQKTEKKAGEPEKDVIIATPSEAVTSGQATEMGDVDPAVIREIVMDEDGKSPKFRAIFKTIVSDLFKTLFRVYISPQAP
jgi:hypothetical protein